MKESRLLVVCLVLFYGILRAQSFEVRGGVGLHPAGADGGVQHYYDTSTDTYIKGIAKFGYSFHFGIGKEIRLDEHWTINGIATMQYLENPYETTIWVYEKNATRNLSRLTNIKSKSQYTSAQAALSLGRNLKGWQIFGGGIFRVRLREWEKEKITTTYSDASVHRRVDRYGNNFYRRYHVGVLGGISFPLLSSKNGQLKGHLTVAQDLNPSYRDDNMRRVNYQLTSITTGIIYKPANFQKTSTPAPVIKPKEDLVVQPIQTGDSLMGKAISTKKIPLSGFNIGISQHEVLFLSVNAGYLTKRRFGIDASWRSTIISDLDITSVFLGMVYQIGYSRFFAKSGIEATYEQSEEFDDINKTTFGFVGIKYMLPFSKCIGLQVDTGIYLALENETLVLPALGIGIGFGHFGPKAP